MSFYTNNAETYRKMLAYLNKRGFDVSGHSNARVASVQDASLDDLDIVDLTHYRTILEATIENANEYMNKEAMWNELDEVNQRLGGTSPLVQCQFCGKSHAINLEACPANPNRNKKIIGPGPARQAALADKVQDRIQNREDKTQKRLDRWIENNSNTVHMQGTVTIDPVTGELVTSQEPGTLVVPPTKEEIKDQRALLNQKLRQGIRERVRDDIPKESSYRYSTNPWENEAWESDAVANSNTVGLPRGMTGDRGFGFDKRGFPRGSDGTEHSITCRDAFHDPDMTPCY